MDKYWPRLGGSISIPGLEAFLGGQVMIDMFELLNGTWDDVAFVLACFWGVDEGVDLWSTASDPRFRLRFTAGDINRESHFVVYDDIVRKMSPVACNLLVGMVGGGSLYPI
ncbi:hypothetical protein L195_g040401, partial [Trifolium pratense]